MGVILMGQIYRHSFVNPYPNGWKDKPDQTTPIDAAALQPYTDALRAIDNFLDGVDKDNISRVKKRVLTKLQYDALPDTKYTDGVIYFITDGGSGISYPNFESEEF